jgi:mono/diheme cytochrome c family protein
MRFALRLPATGGLLVSSLIFCFAAQGVAEVQGDAKAGRAKAESVCAVCHGADGLAKIPEAPNLAGQNENYLIAQRGVRFSRAASSATSPTDPLTRFSSQDRALTMLRISRFRSSHSIGRLSERDGGNSGRSPRI